MKLSVITATYNAVEHLPKLIESLRNQEDKDFEWVVADGASTDGTLELLQSITDLNIKISNQEDFGIYDAINRAIKISSGEYYLVVGADDLLYNNAISDYKLEIDDEYDIITADVDSRSNVIRADIGAPVWLRGASCYISSHAVGSVYKKELHSKNGFYCRKFPILSDQLFIMKSIENGAKLKSVDKVVGFFNETGVSSNDVLGVITEFYRIQLQMGRNKFLQTLVFILRLLKHYFKY